MPPKRKYDDAGTDVDDQADAFAERNRDYGHGDADPNEAEDARLAAESDEWAKAEGLAAELAGDIEPAPGNEWAEVEGETLELTRAEADQWRREAPEPEPAASAPDPGFSAADEYREILRDLGARRTELAGQVSALEVELYAAIRGARAAGVPKQVIAKDAGVARQTVYNVLGKEAV